MCLMDRFGLCYLKLLHNSTLAAAPSRVLKFGFATAIPEYTGFHLYILYLKQIVPIRLMLRALFYIYVFILVAFFLLKFISYSTIMYNSFSYVSTTNVLAPANSKLCKLVCTGLHLLLYNLPL
jgi:hypothetical protein